MNIPSNFTLEETLKALPDSSELDLLRSKLDPFVKELAEAKKELEEEIRSNEAALEQSNFRQDLLEEVLNLLKTTGNKKTLVVAIKSAYENSQVGL